MRDVTPLHTRHERRTIRFVTSAMKIEQFTKRVWSEPAPPTHRDPTHKATCHEVDSEAAEAAEAAERLAQARVNAVHSCASKPQRYCVVDYSVLALST